MEVLVIRPSRRTSHILVLALILVVATAVFATIQRLGKSHSGPPSPTAISQVDPAPLPALPAGPLLAAAITPAPVAASPNATTQPTLAPATLPVASKAEAPLILSGTPLADARAKSDAGDLLTARRILNDSLIAAALTGPDIATAKQLLATINQQMLLGRKVFADDPFTMAYTVKSGDRLTNIANTNSVTWELLCRINNISDPRKVRALQTIKLIKGPFFAVISKSAFTMELYLGAAGGPGSLYVMSFPVGLGKDDSTPAGTWKVELHQKLKKPVYYSPRGEGVIQADDPRNPLGLFWIGLTGVDGQAVGKASYGIHGTIDPKSIGKQESMGCIRLRNEDVAVVFELLYETKSLVVVKD